MDVRVCTRCGIEKPESSFYFIEKKSKYSCWCRNCKSEVQRARRERYYGDNNVIKEILRESIIEDFDQTLGSDYVISCSYIYNINEKKIRKLGYSKQTVCQFIARMAKKNGFKGIGKGRYLKPESFPMENFI